MVGRKSDHPMAGNGSGDYDQCADCGGDMGYGIHSCEGVRVWDAREMDCLDRAAMADERLMDISLASASVAAASVMCAHCQKEFPAGATYKDIVGVAPSAGAPLGSDMEVDVCASCAICAYCGEPAPNPAVIEDGYPYHKACYGRWWEGV